MRRALTLLASLAWACTSGVEPDPSKCLVPLDSITDTITLDSLAVRHCQRLTQTVG